MPSNSPPLKPEKKGTKTEQIIKVNVTAVN